MKKIISCFILSLFIGVMITGCKTCISSETFKDEAVIVKTVYTPTRIAYVHTGKVTSPIIYPDPASYDVTLSYDGIEHQFDNSSLYNYCKKHEGESIQVDISIDKFDDGTTRTDIVNWYID